MSILRSNDSYESSRLTRQVNANAPSYHRPACAPAQNQAALFKLAHYRRQRIAAENLADLMGYRIMSKTEDQYEAEHIQRMGQPLGVVFNELYSELVWLYVKWAEFVDLFGTDPERVDLLNRAAPNFFGIIQEVLFEHITLHVARLTDRVKSLGKENLTVQELPILVQPEMREPIQRLVEEAKVRTEFCRQWRNRRIAHNDRALALKQKHAKPLPLTSRRELREALHAIADILNAVSERYGFGSVSFEHTGPALGGADLLLHVLASGLARKH